MTQPRHWYHCSETFHGLTWTAPRKAPRNMGKDEPSTPRLCVCPSVASCFAARLFRRDVYVYRTAKERRAVAPRQVHDARLTGERWLIPPVPMEFAWLIPGPIVAEASRDMTRYLVRENKPPTIAWIVHAFSEAIRVLKPHEPEFVLPHEERFVKLCKKSWPLEKTG